MADTNSPKKEIKHASANAVKINVYDSAHEYAKAGRVEALTELLESHQDDDTFVDHFHTKSGTTWLTSAAAEGQIDIVNLLLESECSIDLPDGKGNTALIQAACHGYDDIVDALIQRNANINIQNHHKDTALCCAAHHGHKSVVELLLANDASVHYKNSDEETAFALGVRFERLECATMLLEGGSDVDLPDVNGVTPLTRAAFGGRMSTLQYLFATAKPDVAAKNRNGETALTVAVRNRQSDICRLLISQGVPVNSVDDSGRTALMWACMGKHNDMANILLGCNNTKTLESAGAQTINVDVDVKDLWGSTALSYCARDPTMQAVLEWLVELGATVNIQDRMFETPLFVACRSQNIKAVVFLLQSGGADTALTNQEERAADYYLEDPEYKVMYNETRVRCISKVKHPEGGYRAMPGWTQETAEIT